MSPRATDEEWSLEALKTYFDQRFVDLAAATKTAELTLTAKLDRMNEALEKSNEANAAKISSLEETRTHQIGEATRGEKTHRFTNEFITILCAMAVATTAILGVLLWRK